MESLTLPCFDIPEMTPKAIPHEVLDVLLAEAVYRLKASGEYYVLRGSSACRPVAEGFRLSHEE